MYDLFIFKRGHATTCRVQFTELFELNYYLSIRLNDNIYAYITLNIILSTGKLKLKNKL